MSKRLRIFARGLARDTVVNVPKNRTLIVETSELEIDGCSFQVGPEPITEDDQSEFELFLAPCPKPRINRGDCMIAVVRNQKAGSILFKNCTFDASQVFEYGLATDSIVEIQTSVLKNSSGGLTVRNGGICRIIGCHIDKFASDVETQAHLFVDSCTVHSSNFRASGSAITIDKSNLTDCTVHAYSEGKISIDNGSKFTQKGIAHAHGIYAVYGTQYSSVSVRNSEFDGGDIAMYVYGGSLLSAKNVLVRNAISHGIRYSEGCSGEITNCEITECEGNGICIQKKANPDIKDCKIENNGGLGIVSRMDGFLNIYNCRVLRNDEGGIKSEGGRVIIKETRVFLNNGPGITVADDRHSEIVECEVGQNAYGQLLIGGIHWYPPEGILHRLRDLIIGRNKIRIIRPNIYS